MSKAQEVFRKVLALGWYGSGEESSTNSSRFMCHAVALAYEEGHITEEENDVALLAIQDYIPNHAIILRALKGIGFDTEHKYTDTWAPTRGREFFYNWDERPALTEVM